MVDLIQYYQDLNYIYERLHIESKLLKSLSKDIYLESLQRALLKNNQKSIRFVPIAGNSKMKSFILVIAIIIGIMLNGFAVPIFFQ